MTTLQDRIFAVIKASDTPLFTSQIAQSTLTTNSNCAHLLNRLLAEGKIERSKGTGRKPPGHRWRVAPQHRRQSQEARA